MRFFSSRLLTILLLLVLGLCSAGCDSKQVLEFVEEVRARPVLAPPTAAIQSRQGDWINVATFNIQVFGQSKLGKPEVMQVLADVARRFDIIAIQEIRSKKDDVMPRYVDLINSDGSQYEFVVGERLGRTISKEQYAFVYDATRIELIAGSVKTVPDPGDDLHREPLAATFRVRGLPANEAFTFTLVNIHTDPDDTKIELDALGHAFQYVQNSYPVEDDVILLGDLNVDARHLGLLGKLPNISYVIPASTTTNTRRTKSYDNIVFNSRQTVEFAGQGDVLNLLTEYGLSEKEALRVSDHLPVWATFSATENGTARQLATRPEGPTR